MALFKCCGFEILMAFYLNAYMFVLVLMDLHEGI